MSLKARFGMEEIDETLDTEAAEGEMVEFSEADVDPVEDFEVIADVVEDTEEAAASLEALVVDLNVYMGKGGLGMEGAFFADQLYRQLAKQAGVAPAAQFSLESFEGSNSRLRATEYAIEGIGATIKAAWAKIKAWVGKWRTKVVSWLTKMIPMAAIVKNRANKLAASAKDAKGSPKEKQLELSGVEYAKLSVSGKLSGDLKGDLEALAALYGEAAGDKTTEAIKEAIKDATTIVGPANAGTTLPKAMDKLTGKRFFEAAAKAFNLKENAAEFRSNDTNFYAAGNPVLGSKRPVLHVQVSEDGVLRNFTFSMVNTQKTAFNDKYKVDALNASDIESLAKGVADAMDGLNKHKDAFKARAKAAQELQHFGDLMADGKVEQLNDKGEVKAAGFFAGLTRSMSNFITGSLKPDVEIKQAIFASSKAALNYGYISYKNLSTGK